jgi:hypothetical protein
MKNVVLITAKPILTIYRSPGKNPTGSSPLYISSLGIYLAIRRHIVARWQTTSRSFQQETTSKCKLVQPSMECKKSN